MDDDLSAKAPVTRLRRRMSVEAEDSPLPTTPLTPSKKRTTRLAAKPQLELIDELATENVPKKTTRKAAVKENVENDLNTTNPTPVTPSRRVTRTRSNTSILSETTTQNVESPRAKRALRRNSQLGSDTESAAVTPARQTRRTRKDSATNIDKPEDLVTSTNADPNETDNISTSTRKSPRLQNKKGGKADVETDKSNKEREKSPNNSVNTNKSSKDTTPVKNNHMETNENNANASPEANQTEVKQPVIVLVDEIIEREKKNSALNKSSSAIEKIAHDLKNKRNRTKSWTTLSSPPTNVGSISDNEENKQKIKESKTPNTSLIGCGDSLPKSNEEKGVDEHDTISPNKSMNASKTLMNTVETGKSESIKSDTAKLFEKSPNHQEPFLLMEDSDSCSIDKHSIDIQIEGDDQCVPVVTDPTNESPIKHEQSVEPMDIDESMPANVTIDDFSDKSNTSKDDLEIPGKRKSSVTEKSILKEESPNKSKRQSSISIQIASETTTKGEENKNDTINKSIKDLSIYTKDKSNRSSSFSQVPLEIDENESRKSSDKSQRKSSVLIDDKNNENLNESSNKSKRKSSVSLNISENQNINASRKSLDKSQSKTSISVGDQNDELSDSSNKSKRKSSVTLNNSVNQNVNESRKSLDKSQRKTSITVGDQNDELSDSSNKSKRKSSVTLNDSVNQNVNESRKSLNKSERKTSILVAEQNDEELSEDSNKSKRKSSVILDNSYANKIDKESRKLSMSVDENNAENINESSNKSKRKSSISQNTSAVNQKSTVDESSDTKNPNKSKRNSSVSHTDSQNLENVNENKSTLVISQLKDVTTNDTNNIMSPNVTTNDLSKSINCPDVKDKGLDKKNLSLNYLTSTPIQQKPLHKLTMQINTSIISPAVDNKSEKTPKKNAPKESDFSDQTDEEIKFKNKNESLVVPKKKYGRAPSSSDSSDDESDTESKTPIKKELKKSIKKTVPAPDSSDSEEESEQKEKLPNKKVNNRSKSDSKVKATKAKTPNKKPPSDSSDSSADSDEDVSKDRSKIVDDEASEASDDYESGDSQNEEDRRYEAENEIVDKGETLESEKDFSNDSDYEKDSFIVSSDAEDNDILSGTGDDLSLSDNELTMSAKSKAKFNKRKLKQQKNASREMYEARHANDESANSSKPETAKSKKSKRQRLDSSVLESDNDNTKPKKQNRLRIDSSQDGSMVNSDADQSIGKKKKKIKRLSESVHEITTNEKEITICNQSTTDKNDDPLSAAVKKEPKTPQKPFDMSTVAINHEMEEVEVDSNATIMRQNESSDPLQATMMVDDVDDSSSSDNMEIVQNYDSVLNNLSMQAKKIKTMDISLNLNKKSKDSKDPVIDQLNLTQTKKSKKNKKKTVEDKPEESVKSQSESKAVKVDEDSSDSIDMKLLFPEDSNDSEINASQFKPKTNEEPVEDFIPLKRTDAQTNIPAKMDTSANELNVSKKKNKKRKSSLCVPEDVTTEPVNIEGSDEGIKIIMDTTGTHQELETSMTQTNSSKKKKNKKNKSLMEDSTVLESAVEIDCTDGVAETPVEIKLTSEKKKTKNRSFDVTANNADNSLTVSEIHSEKKKKKKKSESDETRNENTDITILDEMPINTSIKSDKKKKKNKNDVSQNIESVMEAMNSAKKKSKVSISVEDEAKTQNAVTESEEIPTETNISSENKKKKKKKKKNKENLEASQISVDIAGEESDEAPMETSYKSEKKSDATDIVTDDAPTISEKKKHKKNKKKKKKNSSSLEKSDDNVKAIEMEGDVSLKRKRKTSDTHQDPPTETEDVAIIPLTTSNEKKKRKVHLDECIVAAYDDSEHNNGDGSLKKSKKIKNKKNYDNIKQDEVPQHDTKKRKNRDDNNDEKIHKISKQNSFDKIHLPKIPESVIKQLSEKPQSKLPKKTAIATVPFLVEDAERRKNKPSNYLEQSIYLNDSSVKTKKQRSKNKPKVLPFTPTVLTSDSGYTSKFNINVIPGETQFVAQTSNVENFRESFLGAQRINKLGTLERRKMNRSRKISKF